MVWGPFGLLSSSSASLFDDFGVPDTFRHSLSQVLTGIAFPWDNNDVGTHPYQNAELRCCMNVLAHTAVRETDAILGMCNSNEDRANRSPFCCGHFGCKNTWFGDPEGSDPRQVNHFSMILVFRTLSSTPCHRCLPGLHSLGSTMMFQRMLIKMPSCVVVPLDQQ